MSNSINLIAYGTFGNPNGFRQTHFNGNKNLAAELRTFDLNANAIMVFANTKIYAIRKEWISGQGGLSYSVYEYAKEQNSDRNGTFIGSSILFTGKKPSEILTLRILNEFQQNLYNNNVRNNVITVGHSDLLSVSKPRDFDKLATNLNAIEDVNFNSISKGTLVYYCKTGPDLLVPTLKKAVELLNSFDTIYFTESEEVAKFVHQKGLFKLMQTEDFEGEIKKIAEEKSRSLMAFVSNLENERQLLESNKNKTILDFKDEIKENELRHQANDRLIKESKDDLETINANYLAFTNKILEIINHLKISKDLNLANELYNENKQIFIQSIKLIKKYQPVVSINKPKVNTNINRNPQINYSENSNQGNFQMRQYDPFQNRNRRKFNKFKVSTFVLLIFWICTIVYFQLKAPERGPETIIQQKEIPPRANDSNTGPFLQPQQNMDTKLDPSKTR